MTLMMRLGRKVGGSRNGWESGGEVERLRRVRVLVLMGGLLCERVEVAGRRDGDGGGGRGYNSEVFEVLDRGCRRYEESEWRRRSGERERERWKVEWTGLRLWLMLSLLVLHDVQVGRREVNQEVAKVLLVEEAAVRVHLRKSEEGKGGYMELEHLSEEPTHAEARRIARHTMEEEEEQQRQQQRQRQPNEEDSHRHDEE